VSVDATEELPRIIIDESSLDIQHRDVDEASRTFGAFADALQVLLLTQQRIVLRSDLLYGQPCLGVDLATVLFDSRRAVPLLDHDVRRRVGRLLDRCQSWSELTGLVEPGSGLDLAVDLALKGHNLACLVIDLVPRRAFHQVTVDARTAEIFFFAEAGELTGFWRALFRREGVDEQRFFILARDAFDNLVLARSLSFRHFDGTYYQLRDPVVKILSVLNDHFARAFADCRGVPHEVQAQLGRFGSDVSPESPGTHRKAKLMARRTVAHDGRQYRCEWHAKIERHRNRIHFAPPDPTLGGRILIGIFADHLPT